MSFLVISEILPPRIGGSGRWLWELYSRIDEAKVVFASGGTPDVTPIDTPQDFQIYRDCIDFRTWGILNPVGLWAYSRALAHLRRILKTHFVADAPRSVHCARCVPEGLLGWALRLTRGIPYICYVHGEELNIYRNSKELRFLARQVMANAQSFIVNSQNTRSILVRDWGIGESVVHVLNPGVDTRKFHPSDSCSSARNRLGWSGRTVVLTVSRLQRRKGHDMLIRALPEIVAAVPNALYSIVGGGEEFSNLHALVDELKLGGQVQFRGEVAESEMIECYQQCDLFVLPNREVDGDFEGFGMVLVEAQACGKAVVAGDSGGTIETINPPLSGVLVDCTTTEQLSQIIVKLLKESDLRERMGDAARRWVVERFDWNVLADNARRIFVEPNRSNVP